jgi:methylphosphotriester-DNA--protein-cysteine methyltransferase
MMNRQEMNILHAEECIEQTTTRMTVKEVSQELKIHPSDLYRLFSRTNGWTPKNYLDEHFKYLLQEFSFRYSALRCNAKS